MWISDFSITKPIVTIVTMLTLVLFGLVALFILQTDEFPEINPPVVAVSIPYPGASPGSVEREVVDPIEDGISGISGVDRISSTSFDSYAVIIVEFVFEKDLQEATQDIRDKISEIRQDLPPEMEEPILARFDPNAFPIVSMTLSSERFDSAELTKIADPGITGELQGVSGVAQVTVKGGVQPELTVELHPDALQAAGVSVGQVVQALQFANLAAPVGRITTDREERTIRLQGRLETPEEFEKITVFSTTAGGLVRLGDLATVRAGTEEARSIALFDGKEAVGIDVTKATNASTTDVSERVKDRLDDIRATLPEGVELTVVRDSGVRVEHSVSDVQKTLFEGAALTVLVVFLFLGSWRSTVITGLALPVSVLASFITVYAFGYTLNTMSLLGLSLAIGILIDDAIVVRENIVRHMEMGKDHYTAAREGTAEIGLAVAATTFSIVVVFVPVAFMGGMAEQWMGPMAMTIASSVMVSLFVSFSLDPMLSAYWADPVIEDGERGFVGRIVHRFDQWLDRRILTYKKVIKWALNHRIAMVAIAFFAFVGALALPVSGLVGTSFFPIQDVSEFEVIIDVPPGSSLEYTRSKALEAAKIAMTHEGVEHTYATIGGQTSVDQANLYVRLTPKADRDIHQEAISGPIIDEIDHLAGVEAALSGGFGPEKQIQIELRGPDTALLSTVAEQLAAEVSKVEGAADVGLSTRGQRPELAVTLNRDLAANLGLSVGQVAQALRPAFAGIDVGDWVDPQGETRDVTVRFAPESRKNAEDLESLPLVIQGQGGTTTIPLGQVADIVPGRGPAQIQHVDRARVVKVEANPRDLPLSAVMDGINKVLDEFEMPAGVQVVQGGDVDAQADVFGRMFGALGIAVLLMYLILVVQFGSFTDPIAIMASLPLSLIGVMLALLVTGSTVNLMSMIGILLLMGIVAKNAILLIDFAKWAQDEQGIDRKSAIIEAGGIRLRPILMTSVAVVAGMIPVAMGTGEGADFRAPLGRAVIGGVITSTMLTLLVIPTFYDMISEWRDRAMALVLPKKDPATTTTHHGRPHSEAAK